MYPLQSTHQHTFAQHNNDSNLVIDSRDSFDSCKRLFSLNRSRVLGIVDAMFYSVRKAEFNGSKYCKCITLLIFLISYGALYTVANC